MSRPPDFSLTFNGRPLATLPLQAVGVAGGRPTDAQEVWKYGFEVGEREPDTEYRVRLGDYDYPATAARGRRVEWDDAEYFGGVRGRADVKLQSRPDAEDGPWVTRAVVAVRVTATKLSDARYAAMVNELRELSAGLVFDLYSKSSRSVALGTLRGGVSSRSSQVELHLLEQLWAGLSAALREVAAAPVTRIAVARRVRPTGGADRLDARAVAQLAAQGIDPRHPRSPRPLRASLPTFGETADTAEHRALLGALDFLKRRVGDCRRSIAEHAKGLTEDEALRDHSVGDGPNLFDKYDRPRLASLAEADGRAGRLTRSIAAATNAPLFRGLTPATPALAGQVFEHVRPYRRFRDEFGRYLHSSLVLLDDGDDLRLKSTDRLYEQWVFFRVAAGLRGAGLLVTEESGVFHRVHRFRFTADLDRGACLTFRAAGGRVVRLRYEPWIRPYPQAKARGDTLYKGGRESKGSTAWSPDVVLEFSAAGSGVEYAVVLDAKYTGQLRDRHWTDTDKYLAIQATHSRNTVVRQRWLVWPSAEAGVRLADADTPWTGSDQDGHWDDPLSGAIGLAPPDQPVRPGDAAEVMADYLRALFAYLEVHRPK